MTDTATPAALPIAQRAHPQTAARVAVLFPELSPGVAVTVYPSWSREAHSRAFGEPGIIVRHARNGYVTVREDAYGTTCDRDPRDIIPRDDQAPAVG